MAYYVHDQESYPDKEGEPLDIHIGMIAEIVLPSLSWNG
jgi:hypothetical protein